MEQLLPLNKLTEAEKRRAMFTPARLTVQLNLFESVTFADSYRRNIASCFQPCH